MNSDPFQIIYIAGAGRSGSTLLSNILGQIPGAVSVGELYYIWERGLKENILCGCGAPFRECPFWADVLAQAQTALGLDGVDAMLAGGISGARTRHIPLLLTANGRARYTAASQPFIDFLAQVYAAIRRKTDSSTIIDASKFPTFGYLLTQIPGAAVSVVHLIRDPRAVGFSWQRLKYNPDSQKLFGRMGIDRSAAIWDSWNVGAELLSHILAQPHRYLRLRYETFIEEPHASLARILDMAGLEVDPQTIVAADHTVAMRPEHTIAGNPVRFHKAMQLRLDEEWKTAMSAGDRALTTALTWPLLRRYGYPLR